MDCHAVDMSLQLASAPRNSVLFLFSDAKNYLINRPLVVGQQLINLNKTVSVNHVIYVQSTQTVIKEEVKQKKKIADLGVKVPFRSPA